MILFGARTISIALERAGMSELSISTHMPTLDSSIYVGCSYFAMTDRSRTLPFVCFFSDIFGLSLPLVEVGML